MNIGFYEGPVLCILVTEMSETTPSNPGFGYCLFFLRAYYQCVKQFIKVSAKWRLVLRLDAARRAHVFQNCIRSIPVKHALSRAPCIVATSVHHCMKQQDRRQYNTLTNKFKVKEAEIFDLQFHRSSRSRSTHKRRLEIYFFIASLQLIINVTYLI